MIEIAEARRVKVRGIVQGVGFRFTAQQLARSFPVTGSVRNLTGGGVELIVEGDDNEVQSFIDAVKARMAEYIRGHTIQDETPVGLQDFTIR